MLLGDIIVPSCSKDKLWNALADAVNVVSMYTTEKFTGSAEDRLLFVAHDKGKFTNHLSQFNQQKILF